MNDRPPCKKCGQVHQWCNGHRKGDGQPCGRPPKTGAPVCHVHGGAASQVKAAAADRVVEAELREVARKHLDNPDAEPMQDPGDKLLRLATRVEDALTAVGRRVNMLNEIGVVTMAGGEQVKAEVKVWTDFVKILLDVLVNIERLGVEKRLAGVTERNSEVFGQLLRAILSDLDLSGEQSARVPEVVGRHLRALSA